MADDVTSDGNLPCYILDRLFYSFSDGVLSDVRDNWNNDNVQVNDGGELDTNSGSGIFDRYLEDE